MKQYPLYNHDLIDSIEKLQNVAKAKMSIWNTRWNKPMPAIMYMNMQLNFVLHMIEEGLLYAYRPKVYQFYDALPYENQVPEQCISRCCLALKDERGRVICHNKYKCDTWVNHLNK